MAHYELRPFAAAEAEMVASWIASNEEREALDGGLGPLTGDDVAFWTLEANWAFTLRRDGDLVAYGEVVEDEVEGDAEIQHLLVAPDARGAEAGRTLLHRLCDFLAETRPYPDVWLRAGQKNAAMIACARAAGFVDVAALSGPRFLWLKKQLIGPPAPNSGGV